MFDDRYVMNVLRVHDLDSFYKKHGVGCEVNDGKFLNFIDDNESEPYPLFIPTKDVGGSAFISRRLRI